LIEEVGRVRNVSRRGDGLRIEVEGRIVSGDISQGDSVAVNGVCLTVNGMDGSGFSADVVGETVRRTYLDRLRRGSPVQLERAVRAGDRLGGHIVQGHVDGIGVVAANRKDGTGRRLAVRFDTGLAQYFVEKGSVALDGASLTIAAVTNDRIEVALIPATLENTIFPSKRPGDPVHIEVDVIAKYVERYMEERETPGTTKIERFLENDHG